MDINKGLPSWGAAPGAQKYTSGLNQHIVAKPMSIATQPRTTTATTGGGTSGGTKVTSPTVQTNQSAYVDPYAQWGGQSAFNTLRDGFNTQKSNVFQTASEAGDTAARNYNSSILDYLDSLRSGQGKINSQGANNELAKIHGRQGVQGMVGRGVRSGGVMLANKNAGDSSATDAISRAYGDIGRREMAKVGNQYELGNREIAGMQSDLDIQEASGARKLEDSKHNVVSGIVEQSRNSLAAIDAAMLDAGIGERIELEGEKQRIKNETYGKLAQYDAMLNAQRAAINPNSIEQRRAEAAGLATAGLDLGEGEFDFNTEAPAQFQNTGGMGGQLPIFTYKRREV